MINLDSVLKSRDFTLLTKVHIYSQSYGFSSSHLWMWELDHKKGLALKNWETLERPLDFKIKLVNPKGNQPWILIRRTDAEADAPILWPLDWKRPWCWERLKAEGEVGNREWDGWMVSLIQWTWTWANFRRWWRTGRPGMLQSMGSQRVRCNLETEQQWLTELWFESSLHIKAYDPKHYTSSHII